MDNVLHYPLPGKVMKPGRLRPLLMALGIAGVFASIGTPSIADAADSDNAPGDLRMNGFMLSLVYGWYRFWIDDRDLPSIGVFSFLKFLFTLTESGSGQVSPVLTVPAG